MFQILEASFEVVQQIKLGVERQTQRVYSPRFIICFRLHLISVEGFTIVQLMTICTGCFTCEWVCRDYLYRVFHNSCEWLCRDLSLLYNFLTS